MGSEVGAAAGTTVRLHGVDVARGLAVVGMLFVDNRGNAEIGEQFVHAPWHGLRLADVVFPVFLLVVGVSMPFSRRADRPGAVVLRVLKLALLGWLIVVAKYGFDAVGAGVLGHVAGAYLLCWLLLRLPRRAQVPTAAAVLAVLTLVAVLVPVPGTGRTAVEPDASWAHWFDDLLGLDFSAEAPHSYLPSAVTVFLGVLAGRALLECGARGALPRMLAGAGALLVVGLAVAPLLPVNKRLWTPSFVLVTGGIGLLVLATAIWLVDVRGVRRPFRPAEVLGLNAIVAFATSELLFRALLRYDVQPAVDRWLTGLTSATTAAYLYAGLSVVVVWAVCQLLARRGIVVRI
ncbi:heparan-alpha-glucosaminide N-acetyltransferase domain-containing protein [Klenkia sp. LSe6-5]|uniref:Heparan-alpha-glucosaminide N-acetyltransferase domain-containing protein n=1 Tax=Klenkia sesuvii TaxID=3103137 RepID=A0ABU8DY44_9ACTN